MSKPIITRLFLGGVVAFIAGLVLAIASVVVAFAGGVFEVEGHDVVGLHWNGAGYAMVMLGGIGAFALVGGALAGLVAWVGALLNTIQLPDKAWFIVLLVLGVLSFGFVAMIAYVIAGPDATTMAPPQGPRATPIPA